MAAASLLLCYTPGRLNSTTAKPRSSAAHKMNPHPNVRSLAILKNKGGACGYCHVALNLAAPLMTRDVFTAVYVVIFSIAASYA